MDKRKWNEKKSNNNPIEKAIAFAEHNEFFYFICDKLTATTGENKWQKEAIWSETGIGNSLPSFKNALPQKLRYCTRRECVCVYEQNQRVLYSVGF